MKFGGSATIGENGLNQDYLGNFLEEVGLDLIRQFEKAVFVIGGGVRARRALNLGGPDEAVKVTRGHAGQLSFELNKVGIACDFNIPINTSDLERLIEEAEFAVSVGGLELGQTTDAVAITAANKLADLDYQVSIVVLSNIEAIYTDDPKKIESAQAIKQASLPWLIENRILLGDAKLFTHGMNVPLDPVAVQRYSHNQSTSLFFTGADNTQGVREFLGGQSVQSGTLISEGVETCFYS